MKSTQKICLLLISALSIYIGLKISEAYADDPEVYIINKDAKCGKKGADKLVYCMDKQGNPITGSVHKLKNGLAIRRYAFENGYLNGISEIYDDYGHLTEARPYTKGVLGGDVYYYNRRGKVIAIEPHKDGRKEGVATYTTDKKIEKKIYVEDKLNGNSVIYDRKWVEFNVTPDIASGESIVRKQGAIINKLLKDKNKTGVIYRFVNADNKTTSGQYFYLTCSEQKKDCEATIKSVDMPQLILNGIANQCLKLHEALNFSACTVQPEIMCDNEWATLTQSELETYFKDCQKATEENLPPEN